MTSRRHEALQLAEELLADLELTRIGPVDAARKTYRLARLLDDTDAMEWLRYEVGGYPQDVLDEAAARAAQRSNRAADAADDGTPRWWTLHLATFHAHAEAAAADLGTGDPTTSSSDWAMGVERQKAERRAALRQTIAVNRELVERVVGAFHTYATAKYQELRFGAAVETAFEVVREEVDASIAELVPDALPKLNAAFENTTSNNPEDWASAAATCRRLLKAAADALRPPGPDVGGRKMGEDRYLNRLIDWIVTTSTSETAGNMIAADVEYLGRRLEAALDAGHKGTHAEVTRFDASRFVTGTYLLLGDVLRLRAAAPIEAAH